MPRNPAIPWRPTREQIAAARQKRLTDVIGPGLDVLFCGINPGLYSAAVGHHFARPGNRFWPALHAAGFTDRLLSPFEDRGLLSLGYGLTNIAGRTTAGAEELTPDELREAAAALEAKVRRFRPHWVAFLGVGAYRTAFGRPKAAVGPQPEPLAHSSVWALPSPSGLNAHYHLEALVDSFQEMRRAVFPSA
jgi:TDG/mug DNA glycosylase family protein